VAVSLAGALRSRPAERRTLEHAVRLGAPTVPHLLGVFIIALGDRVVIQMMEGSAAVGRYQIAYALGALPQTLLMGLQNAWLPITFGSNTEERWSTLAANTTVVVRLAGFLVAGVALVAPLGLSILAPPTYRPVDLAPVTAVIALAVLPWATYLPLVQLLIWQKRTALLMRISLSAAAINLLAAMLLVHLFGLIGAAAATLIALGSQAALAAVAAPIAVPWDRRATARSFAVTLGMVGAAIAIPGTPGGLMLRSVLFGVVAVLAVRTIRRAVAP
jgi:O-antigen/teichoic acid export membrane protein